MIILMITSYSTIHVGMHVYHHVSESTWQCYCKFIRWAIDNCMATGQMFQGGWGIKING